MPNEVKLLPCPLCTSALSPYITHRLSEQWWEHPANGCPLSGFTIAPNQIAAWNTRPTTLVTDEVVERVARAICIADGKNPDADWRATGDVFLTVAVEHPETWRLYLNQARAAIASMPTVVTGEQPDI